MVLAAAGLLAGPQTRPASAAATRPAGQASYGAKALKANLGKERIILPAGEVFADETGPTRVRLSPDGRSVAYISMEAVRAAAAGPPAQVVRPVFGRTGKKVVVVAGDRTDRNPKLQIVPVGEGKTKQLKATGIPLSPCPTTDVLPLNLPGLKGAKKVNPALYDLKADKVAQRLPCRSEHVLAPFRPSWTADGQYFCYPDEHRVKVAGGMQTKQVSRVGDRIAKKEAEVLGEMTPVGPGPGKTTIVLFRSRGRHDKPLVAQRRPSAAASLPTISQQRTLASTT